MTFTLNGQPIYIIHTHSRTYSLTVCMLLAVWKSLAEWCTTINLSKHVYFWSAGDMATYSEKSKHTHTQQVITTFFLSICLIIDPGPQWVLTKRIESKSLRSSNKMRFFFRFGRIRFSTHKLQLVLVIFMKWFKIKRFNRRILCNFSSRCHGSGLIIFCIIGIYCERFLAYLLYLRVSERKREESERKDAKTIDANLNLINVEFDVPTFNRFNEFQLVIDK